MECPSESVAEGETINTPNKNLESFMTWFSMKAKMWKILNDQKRI